MSELAITFGHSTANEKTAELLAGELDIPIMRPEQVSDAGKDFLLRVAGNGVELVANNINSGSAVRVDFENPTLAYRVKNKVKRQAIIRAVGVKPGLVPSVLDATAGLGKDAYLLATAGCQIHMLERDKIVHALLRDGLERASRSKDSLVRATVKRMELSLVSLAAFKVGAKRFDVVYLDPMFPARRKSAQVKKDIFILQKYFEGSAVGADDNELLDDALSLASRRVVVKRPVRAPDLGGKVPTFRMSGRTSRFDVYATAGTV